ncbi:SusC/RagA family TonB-linked outer membrane protein [Membranihabitans maritimus]|uniref:SusC/RagA family TonB-linked outer membrane protein n=1 Tax=Membranihabitans maritimus TaxID=2904244 RepID=UPI001F36C73B|nr:TonB-dependent receptor [Membranihabitans maritimus]
MNLKGFTQKKWLMSLFFLICVVSAYSGPTDVPEQQEIPLVEAIQKISKDYGVYFSFDRKLVENITVEYHSRHTMSLEEAISFALKNTDLQFKMFDQEFVIIYRKDEEGMISLRKMMAHIEKIVGEGDSYLIKPTNRLPLRKFYDNPYRELKGLVLNVKGTVIDNKGEPLIGVNVRVKGADKGTATDFNGMFTLQDVNENATLVFSYIGYQTIEIPVDGRVNIEVTMISDSELLDEIVVVGYGTQKRSDLTGSVSSVPMEHIRNQPIRSIGDILQGRAAGMSLTRTSGQTGSNIKMRIRGPNSISGSNEPLMVVDGVIGGNIGSIHDVESIEILKDASATAIYGERASNGVILVTTKQATSEVPQVRIALNSGFSYQNTDYPDMMSAAEYAEFVNDLRGEQIYSSADIADFRQNGGTNWPSEVMQTGLKNDYNITYSQKLDKVGIYLSGRYVDERGTMRNNSSGGNYQLRSKINFDPIDRLSFSLDIRANKNQSMNGNLSTGTSKSHPLMQALIWSPTEPIWLDQENGIYNLTDNYGALSYNPYMYALEQQQLSMSSGIYTTLTGRYEITDWLAYNVTGYAAKNNSQGANYENIYLEPNDPQASRSSSDRFNWRLVNRIDINKSFDVHNLLLTGVYETEASENWSVGGVGRNMPLPDLASYYNIDLSNLQSVSSGFGESSRLAYLGRLNYNYDSRYYLTASYRVDAQSGPVDRPDQNKYGAFPSFAVSWRASEESFMEDSFFENLKLRLGWGLTGNPSGFPYTRMDEESFPFGIGADVLGYVPGTPANSNIKWEKTTQKDVGLDLSALNGRISMSFDYFIKNTTDLLTQQELPGYYGYGDDASYTQNLGQINNQGFEVTLDLVPVQTSNVYWGMNLNFSRVHNEVIDLGDQAAFMTGTTANGFLDVETYRVQEGLPLGTMWGYKFLGIWRTNEADEAAKYGEAPGDLKFEDVNGDGAINLADDGQKIGDANPDFAWGLSNTVTFKNFDLNFLLQGMHGQDVLNLTRAAMSTAHPDSRTITLKDPGFNYWTPGNEDTEWPNIHSTSSKKRLNSSQWVEDGSWVKLKYVGVTYHLPRNLVNFGDLSLSVSGTDLLTFSGYKGYDPEVSASGSSDVWGGADFGTLPIPRSVIFGLVLDF